MDKKLLFIINPVAGTRKFHKQFLDILVKLCNAGFECQVQTTSPTVSAQQLVSLYGADKDYVVCAGGDGTLNDVVAGCLAKKIDPIIGYIPCGSTNDFATGLGMSLKPIEAVDDILNGKVILLDVGLFNGRPFIYTASFGAFTKASYAAPRELKNSLGYLAYVLEGAKEIGDIQSYHLKITLDDKEVEGDYAFGGICNSTRIGGGVVRFEKEVVNMSDGMFEVFLVKYPKNASEFTQLVFDLNSRNYNSPMIELYNASQVIIEGGDNMDWTIDGEYQRGSEKVTIHNKSQMFPLLLRHDNE